MYSLYNCLTGGDSKGDYVIMPEKRQGMIEKLIGVFRGKKPCCEDILDQAERVISEYVSRRRNEIINKYRKRKNRFLNFAMFMMSVAFLYFVYRILV